MAIEKKNKMVCFSAFAYDYNEKSIALLSEFKKHEFVPKSLCKVVEGELKNSVAEAKVCYIHAPLWLWGKLKQVKFYDLVDVFEKE